jgi:Family of unknown function (DUF5397)
MSKTVYLNNTLITAINRISESGHTVAVESGEGGNSHSVVFITIGVRRAGEAFVTIYMRIKYIFSYQKFEYFMGMDDRFGDLCYQQSPNVEPFLKVIQSTISPNGIPVGRINSFSPLGPKYRIEQAIRQLDDGDWLVEISMTETGDRMKYRWTDLINHPEAR